MTDSSHPWRQRRNTLVDSLPPPSGESARLRARVGTLIAGKWQIESVLGVGGMATVYGAVHAHNKRKVAIKILHPEYQHIEDIRGRFAQEARAANRVSHRGAVPVLDDGELEDGAPYLVMDRLEGQSLQRRLEKAGGALPAAEVFSIAESLLSILEAAHAASVLHRDVKPDNVFLTSEGEVKLLDFGISKVLGADQTHKTQVGAMMGTPSFMSPEQARGRWDELDARADLFAVGATMFMVLSGRAIHQADTINELLLKVMTERAPDLTKLVPDLPPLAGQLVNRALAFDRRERFESAHEMLLAVREVRQSLHQVRPPLESDGGVRSPRSSSPTVSGERTTHRPVTISEWPPSWSREQPKARRQAFLLGAAGLLAVVLSLLVYSSLRDQEATTPSPVAAEPGKVHDPSAAALAASEEKPAPIDLRDLPEEKPKRARAPAQRALPQAPAAGRPAPPGGALPPEPDEAEPVDPLARRR